MQDTINRYIEHMHKKHGTSAAMVAGSYATGKMGPNSDIDVFFIWPREYESLRGREFFEGVEFEYFISPEWKFYDRMRTDEVSVRIYSTAVIVLDPDGKLARIAQVAQEKVTMPQPALSESQVRDYGFWLETIRRDGEDLFDSGASADFAFFTAANIERLTNLLARLAQAGPIYEKYGVEETTAVDAAFGSLLRDFLLAPPGGQEARRGWLELCRYLERKLGNPDIREYCSAQKL